MMRAIPSMTSMVAAAAAAAVIGCAPLAVNTYSDRGADFTQYRTYGWDLAGSAYTGDPRLDSNPFFLGYVSASIDEQLAARGFERTATGMPDLIVRYFAHTEQKVYLTAGGKVTPCTDCRAEVFDEDTLVIDLVDGRTDRLVWRGWAEGSIAGVVEDQAWMERRIYDTVARILNRLPAGLGDAPPVG